MQEFLRKYRVTSTYEWAPMNPFMSDMQTANHYKVTLKYGTRQFTLYYSKGSALKTPPNTKEVLECLYSDMNCITEGFDDFIDNMGYDNYKQARKVYKGIESNTQKLFKLLDVTAFQEFSKVDGDF